MADKKCIIFINAIRPATFNALELHSAQSGEIINPVVFVDKRIKKRVTERNGQLSHLDKVPFITVDFNSPQSIRDGLRTVEHEIIGIVSQYENSVHELQKLLPYVPYLPTPTESSLTWSTEKKLMRELMIAYDKNLVPAFTEVHDLEESTINAIEHNIGYPMVIKPSGLEGALLVSLVQNRDQLVSSLQKGFSEIQKAYDIWIKRQKPFFLAEEFMDGDMFSIDVYLDKNGNGTCTPIVEVVTGRKVGFDDFFGYVRKTPVDNSVDESAAAFAAVQACKSLGLRSITAHVELMRLSNGTWKIIELGPRIGGYRHEMYQLGFGINHIVNDLLVRCGRSVSVNSKPLGHVAMYNIYAKKEGTIKSLQGKEKISELASTVKVNQLLQVGDQALFAKHNGDVVYEVLLFNNDRRQFEADCQVVERQLVIDVEQI